MSTAFKDYFSQQASAYAAFRPTYPETLFAWLSSLTTDHVCVWDCGTGNGQAAMALAHYYSRVVATDASAAQIAAAPPCQHVEYRVAPAEDSGLPEHTVDLVCIAQALHWFDLDRFYAEVNRVLKLDGAIAAWSYGVIEVEHPLINERVSHFYHEVVGSYWPAERRHVETGYRELAFPFEPISAPAFHMTERWPLAALCGYLRSWSATQRYVDAHQQDPVMALEQEIRALWGDETSLMTIDWPLTLRAGRKR